MKSILLVEDQPLFSEYLSRILSEYQVPLEISKKAYNGKEALSFLEQHTVDCIITDIKMPVMDGIALIRALREHGDNTPCLVLSGFGEFEYAQEALRLGVVDYILKPIDRHELFGALDKIFVTVQSNPDTLHHQIEQLFWENNTTENSLSNIPFLITGFTIGGFCMMDYDNDGFSNTVRNEWIQKWMNLLHEETALSHCSVGMHLIHCPEIDWLLCVSVQEPDTQHFAEKFIETLTKLCPYPVTLVRFHHLCIGKELAGKVKVLSSCVKHNLRPGVSAALYADCDEQLPARAKASSPENKLRNLLLYLHSEKYDQFQQILMELLEEMRLQAYTQLEIANILSDINSQLMQAWKMPYSFLSETNRAMAHCFREKMTKNDIFAEIEAKYRELCSQHRFSSEDLRIQELVQKIDTYIKQSYTEPLSIQELADRVHLSSAYLSRVYKQTIGQSPKERITALRLAHARELLLTDASLTQGEIAVLSGYPNPFYFSRLFKEFYGETPSECRQKHLCNGPEK